MIQLLSQISLAIGYIILSITCIAWYYQVNKRIKQLEKGHR